MTHLSIKALEQTGPDSMVWTAGYDEKTRHDNVLQALAPGFLILAIAAGLLVAIL